MTTTKTETKALHVDTRGTRPRHRPHRHRQRMAKARLADIRYLVGPEAAGRAARAMESKDDWGEPERRKERHVGELMKAPTTRPRGRTSAGGHAARPRLPVGTPSSGIGEYTITIEQYHAWHERRREPVSFGLPPLTLPRSYGTAYGWMRTGEAQSEPQALVTV